MENTFRLSAVLHKVGALRYTPAGVPVLDVVLKHESWQQDNGSPYLAKFELAGKIIGSDAKHGSTARANRWTWRDFSPNAA